MGNHIKLFSNTHNISRTQQQRSTNVRWNRRHRRHCLAAGSMLVYSMGHHLPRHHKGGRFLREGTSKMTAPPSDHEQ